MIKFQQLFEDTEDIFTGLEMYEVQQSPANVAYYDIDSQLFIAARNTTVNDLIERFYHNGKKLSYLREGPKTPNDLINDIRVDKKAIFTTHFYKMIVTLGHVEYHEEPKI